MKSLNAKLMGISFIMIGFAMRTMADAPIATSGKNRVQLIELFSSESCSSCPPADAWISTLQQRAELWKSFVPIVFHVDYWNHLGWKDDFSSHEMTKRQIAISKTWPHPLVYTPAVVLDGREWKGWRSHADSFPPTKIQKIELSIFKNDDGSYQVKSSGLLESKKYIVYAAKLGMDISSKIKAGENSGETLKHNFLVLSWIGNSVSKLSSEARFSFSDKENKSKTSRFGIAAWIEEDGIPVPLQAVGTYL